MRNIVSVASRQPDAAASYCRAITATLMSKGADQQSPTAIVRRNWSNDKDAEIITKAASSPAMTSVPSWAGLFNLSAPADFISLLAPASAGAALLGRCVQLEWPSGINSLTIPAIDASPAKMPWQTEGNPIGVVMYTTSLSAPLTPAKLATVIVLSDEILSYSVPSAETLVRIALAESLGQSIDTALLSTAAATATTPAGIFSGITPLTASTSTIASEAMVEDISNVVASVSTVSGNNPVVLLAAAKQAAALNARLDVGAFDVLSCPTLAAGTLAAVAKKLYAEIIDFCDDARAAAGNNEQRRLYSVAITEAQTAQMWVVAAVGVPGLGCRAERQRGDARGARVFEHIARIRVQLPTSCPGAAMFRTMVLGLMRSGP
jgi:hypothetical protein